MPFLHRVYLTATDTGSPLPPACEWREPLRGGEKIVPEVKCYQTV